GNSDRDSKVSHILEPAIIARYVRLRPQSWYGHISMRLELYGCRKGFNPPPKIPCHEHSLGVQSGFIKDSQMSASTIWDINHGAENARLNGEKIGSKTGAWSARYNNAEQWLQVDLGELSEVYKVATQGRQDLNQWVKSYTLAYSRDGALFQYLPKVLSGNKDRDTVQFYSVGKIYARYLRFYPKTWFAHISMRVEVYGSPPVKCAAPLGMKDKSIPDKSITASSEWDANHSPDRSRLDTARQDKKTGAWSARHNNRAQWLQIDFGKATQVTGIVTQGRNDSNQWVQGYKLEFSQDNIHFESYEGGKVLKGNSDRDSKVSHILEPAIIARYVRLRPQSWYGHISMRLELYGCRKGTGFIPCHEHSLGVQSGFIKDSQMSASTIWDINHGAENARLNGEKIGSKTGAWSARYNNAEQWLQVDLGELSEVYKVATQGRQDLNQWVKSYTLAYSRDGALFQYLPKKSLQSSDAGQHLRAWSYITVPCSLPHTSEKDCAHNRLYIKGSSFTFSYRIGFVAPPVKCAAPLGMKDKSIPDKSITASSEWDANHSPDRSRLDTARQDKKTGAWSARHNNRAQWLQIDFGKATQVTGIVTQGRNDSNQWVQGYKLEFSQDNIHFESYEGGKVLKGNSDRDSKVSHILEPAIIARYVRLRPQSWYGHISMRLELYGCRKGTGFIPCHEHSLGVQSGFIKDSQMSASTIWDINHGAENARLNGEKIGSKTGAWSARYNNAEQWLQVDLGELSEVYKVATQGRQDLNQWVKSYTLAYSRDGALFQYLPKLLSGNKDRDTVEFNSVGKIHARYLRFYPKTWFGHISMRVEVYGCHKGMAS
ncbi:predicted protein, partial [Nematostella vectensis]